MEDELYLEPNRRTQTIVLLMIIFGILLFASIDPMISYLTPSKSAPLADLERGAKLLGLLASLFFVFALVISLIWAAYFGRVGYRSLKLGSYPPSGAIVVLRTRVRTGKQAVIAGYLSILLAVLFGLFTIPMGYAIWLFAVAL